MSNTEREKLIVDHLQFVRFIIHKHYPTYANDEDIYQVGCMGLVKAANEYDEMRTNGFMAFATHVILNQIRMHLRKEYIKYSVVSLQEPIAEDAYLEDILEGDDDIDFFDFEPLIKRLTENEKNFMICALKGMNRTEIAKKYKVTKTYVSRVFKDLHSKWKYTYVERT